MDRPPADQLHDLVPDLLELEPALDDRRVITREVDGVLVAEEVGCMEQVHVEGVTLDPLAAIQEPAELVQRSVHGNAARGFDGVACTHLVGDRADPAYARSDVGRFGVPAPAQERFEESRRLVDAQLDVANLAVVDLDVHRAFALDARDRVDLEGAIRGAAVRHGRPSPVVMAIASLASRNGGAPALKVRSKRTTPPSSTPRSWSDCTMDARFGVSIGPKQP